MAKKIIIIGNTNAAKILYGFLSDDDRYEVIAFSVDKEYIIEKTLFNLPLVSINDLETFITNKDIKLVIGIGYSKLNSIRETIYNKLKGKGFNFETYIHSTAVINKFASIGEAVVVLPNSVIEPFSSIGNNTYICSNCTIAHHSIIGENVWIASNTIVSGEASVKNNTFVGVGTTIVNQIVIEEKNIIGAGALITKNTNANDVYLSRNSEKHRFDSLNYSLYFWKE